jgi:hypothetical protein
MKLRLVIVLACTLVGLSACVIAPYGGGERGGGERGSYYGGVNYGGGGDRDDHGGGHQDDSHYFH